MSWLSGGLILLYGLSNLLNAHESSAQTQRYTADFYRDAGWAVSFLCTLPNDDGGVAWRYYSDDEDRSAEIIATNDNLMSSSRYYGRSSVVITSRTYTLTITNLNRNDTGVYKCSAMSDKLEEYRLYVFTTGYPRCTIDDVYQDRSNNVADHSVILTCESGVENNYPEIRWFRDGDSSELASSNQGNILRTQVTISEKNDDVKYKCIVGNGNVLSLPSCSLVPSELLPYISPSTAMVSIGEAVGTDTTLINEYPKTNSNMTDITESPDSSLGLAVGVVVSVVLLLTLLMPLILVFMRRNAEKRKKIHLSSSEQTGKVVEYDDVSVQEIRFSGDGIGHVNDGSEKIQKKEDQKKEIAFSCSSLVNHSEIATSVQRNSHNYEEMKDNQNYQALDRRTDEMIPVYSELNNPV